MFSKRRSNEAYNNGGAFEVSNFRVWFNIHSCIKRKSLVIFISIRYIKSSELLIFLLYCVMNFVKQPTVEFSNVDVFPELPIGYHRAIPRW